MTVQQAAIVFLSCWLSTLLVVGSWLITLERKIAEYHRQELRAIEELKDAIERYGFLDLEPWQYGGTFECTLTPCKIENDKEGNDGTATSDEGLS